MSIDRRPVSRPKEDFLKLTGPERSRFSRHGRPRRRPLVAGAALAAAVLAVAALLAFETLTLAGCGDGTPLSVERTTNTNSDTTSTTAAAPGRQVTVQSITATVSTLRGLPLKSELNVKYEDRTALAAEMQKEMEKEYPDAKLSADERALKAVGLLQPSDDLRQAMTALMTEQIIGYYDDESKQLAIISDQPTIDVMNELTLSHEITHALQDQSFDLQRVAPSDTGNDDADEARLSLIEGDATLTMQDYATSQLSLLDTMSLGISALGETGSVAGMPGTPPYLAHQLTFPYEEGLSFVQALYDRGGWQMVDEAYRNPPISTEQVMHPEKYLAGEQPVSVEIPEMDELAPMGGWSRVDDVALGEFDVRELLRDELGLSKANQAAAGWAGGRLNYYEDSSGGRAVVMLLKFDSISESMEFSVDMWQSLEKRYNVKAAGDISGGTAETPDGFWTVRQNGRTVAVILSPDTTTSQGMAQKLAACPCGAPL